MRLRARGRYGRAGEGTRERERVGRGTRKAAARGVGVDVGVGVGVGWQRRSSASRRRAGDVRRAKRPPFSVGATERRDGRARATRRCTLAARFFSSCFVDQARWQQRHSCRSSRSRCWSSSHRRRSRSPGRCSWRSSTRGAVRSSAPSTSEQQLNLSLHLSAPVPRRPTPARASHLLPSAWHPTRSPTGPRARRQRVGDFRLQAQPAVVPPLPRLALVPTQ